MTDTSFALAFATEVLARIQARACFAEHTGADGGPRLSLINLSDGTSAGYLRLWAATDECLFDRLVHFHLHSASVDTHLIFLMGRADTAMPHFHGQVVQFGPDSCVYNADIVPRLDPVDHPDYFTEVFGPITAAYRKAINDRNNVCALAPANPAIAVYLSPWSIAAARPTDRAELERVKPSLISYVDHCVALAHGLNIRGPSAEVLRARDQRHMACFQSDKLDARAWQGVYRVVGTAVGRQIKEIIGTPLR